MKSNNRTQIEQYVINVVRKKRTLKKMSQIDLAHLLNLSPGFIGKIESSKYDSKYNLNHLNKLAKIFNCSPQSFLPKKVL